MIYTARSQNTLGRGLVATFLLTSIVNGSVVISLLFTADESRPVLILLCHSLSLVVLIGSTCAFGVIRPQRLAQCICGYCLFGIDSAVCPECGKKISSAETDNIAYDSTWFIILSCIAIEMSICSTWLNFVLPRSATHFYLTTLSTAFFGCMFSFGMCLFALLLSKHARHDSVIWTTMFALLWSALVMLAVYDKI